jgi:TolA-binding protein
MRLSRVLSVILLTGSLAGCLPLSNADATAAYARQVAMAMLRVAQMEEMLSTNQNRVEQLEEVIRVQGRHAASRLETMEEVNIEVSRLRGEIEVLRRELDLLTTALHEYQLSQEGRQLRDEARLAQVEKFLGLEPPPVVDRAALSGEVLDPEGGDSELSYGSEAGEDATDGGERVGGSVISEPESGSELEGADQPQTLADRVELAKEHVDQGRYAVARAVLTRAVTENPEAGEVAEMRYIIAQSYLHEENWRAAAGELKTVLDNYGSSPWAPWSMLRLGECFEGLRKGDSAVLFYEGVVQSYPRSDAAKEAKRRLK